MSLLRHHLGNGYFGGWVAPRPDHFQVKYKPAVSTTPDTFEIPGVVTSVPCIDQGQEGSCTGHGSAGVVMAEQYAQGETVVIPSRAMIYYNARIPEGTTDQDSGASVADAVAGVAKYGVCTDVEFPYIAGDFNQAPSKDNYTEADQQKALQTQAVDTDDVFATLASGHAVVDGMTVYSSFMSDAVAATGIVPFPKKGESPEGGHCTWRLGYNRTDAPWTSPSGLVYPPETVGSRNSWRMPDGTWWGVNGCYFLPIKFWTEGLVSDSHVVLKLGAE